MDQTKLAIFGGDRRMCVLASELVKRGINISVYAVPCIYLPEEVHISKSILSALDGADALILPLPVTKDGIHLNCDLGDRSPNVVDILKKANGRPVLSGNISAELKREAENMGVRVIDYFDNEELKIRNSLLTAEGAVSVAMNELDVALCGASSAVVGYGRIGMTLAAMLRSLGADVTVAARKGTDTARAAAFGLNTLKIGLDEQNRSTLFSLCRGYDIIFNTVPFRLFTDEILSKLDRETLFIDLASDPGGFDPEAARRYGIRTVKALSIPGKYAPVSAGRLLSEFVTEILKKEMIL